MHRTHILWSVCALIAAAISNQAALADEISERAHKLHFSSIVLDTHDDTTQRFFSKDYDLGTQNRDGHVDIPRMREGGMNAIFFSIWIDGHIMGPPAVEKALDQIDAVRENVKKHSNDMTLARTADDVRRAHAQGKIAALMGVEGGHMIGNDIRIVRIFADLGVRYMTMENSGRVIRVLLAEDNPGDRMLVREAFAVCPVQIELRCVDNGEEALAVLSDPEYKPDLIIVDLNIPRIDGSQVTRFVKQVESRLRAVPAIVFSSSPYEDAAARSSVPADAFFTKPASLDDYFAICRTWLEPLADK